MVGSHQVVSLRGALLSNNLDDDDDDGDDGDDDDDGDARSSPTSSLSPLTWAVLPSVSGTESGP